MDVFRYMTNSFNCGRMLKLYNLKNLSMRFNTKHLVISLIFRIFASSIQGDIFFKDWQDKFNQLKVKTSMTIAKFKTDETRNNTEYILECIKAALRNYPYDTEYQVDITITTDYGYYSIPRLNFIVGIRLFSTGMFLYVRSISKSTQFHNIRHRSEVKSSTQHINFVRVILNVIFQTG